ncbi:TPA: selenocysteine-specific translation elongation factor [bacterium]|nr:selenocysteine-specific translation elongation factor [bacterium]
MRNVIIGTAGHIDHGKTALIRALTGIETDRWEEEKRRGVSIGLGFAHFDLPDGTKAGIVDVPGHEKFIRNMLTGVWGMDIILLVVDAVEGVRPQTIEHLNIIDLLGISTGIVVITKIDMVSDERVEEVVDQVKALLRGKLLENSPIVRVSSITLQGFDELKEKIIQQINSIKPPRRSFSAPRLPVDRTFVIQGFGMIATGTLIGGKISKQDTVNIMPSGKKARVRGVEVHDIQVDSALPGQRVALNLSGIGKDDIDRGDVVTDSSLSKITNRVDTILRIADSCNRIFENWIRVRFFIGTSEVFGRAVLLSSEEGLLPEESGYVQFSLESPIFAFRGDRFIIRDFTNQETLGGGEILDPFPQKHKRLADATITQMKAWESAENDELVRLIAETNPQISISENDLKYYLPYSGDKQEQLLSQMENSGIIVRHTIGDKLMIASSKRMSDMKDKLLNDLSLFHKERPLAEGANYSKIRSDIDADETTFDLLLQELINDGTILRTGNFIRLSSHKTTFSGKSLKISEQMEKIFIEKGLSPPDNEELLTIMNTFSKDDVMDVFQALIREGKLIKVSNDVIFHSSVLDKTFEILKDYLKKNGTITVSEFRQLVNTSRKYAVPFVEYSDSIGFTVREGDYRRLKIGEEV